MAGTNPILELGPDTWEVSQPVVGGQLVEPDPDAVPANTKVRPAAANSTRVLGSAATDATPKHEWGANYGSLREHTAVRNAPMTVRALYASAAEPGDKLVAASDGRVAKAGAGATADQIVGICSGHNNKAKTDHAAVASGDVAGVRLTV